jgi:hypothetical protein
VSVVEHWVITLIMSHHNDAQSKWTAPEVDHVNMSHHIFILACSTFSLYSSSRSRFKLITTKITFKKGKEHAAACSLLNGISIVAVWAIMVYGACSWDYNFGIGWDRLLEYTLTLICISIGCREQTNQIKSVSEHSVSWRMSQIFSKPEDIKMN